MLAAIYLEVTVVFSIANMCIVCINIRLINGRKKLKGFRSLEVNCIYMQSINPYIVVVPNILHPKSFEM